MEERTEWSMKDRAQLESEGQMSIKGRTHINGLVIEVTE